MLIFQTTGAAYMLAQPGAGAGVFVPADIPAAALAYALKLTVFLAIFVIAGKMVTRPIDRYFAGKDLTVYHPAAFSLLMIAGVAMLAGLFTRYVLIYVPVIGPGMRAFAFGMFAVAAGLAAWAAIPRLRNPFCLIPAAGIIVACLLFTFDQNFGRRNLVAILTMIVWAGYYAHWRYVSTLKLITRLGLVGAGAVALLFAVTSVRSGEFRERGMMENISALREARLSDGLDDVLSGQAASVASMWLIESRPQRKAYDTLHSVRMFLSMPIPRRIWHTKPSALALTMPQKEVYVPGKPKDFNIGPGIIGHVENDNPWIALWLYPIFFGVFFRLLDRTMAWLYFNPFVILPIGTAVGQVIAMPRGELGSFFFNVVLNISGGFVIIQAAVVPLVFLGVIKKEQLRQEPPSDDHDRDHDESPENL